MKKNLIFCLLFTLPLLAQPVQFSNKLLQVTINPKTGTTTILDKRINRLYVQPEQKYTMATTTLGIPQQPHPAAAITLDHKMTGNATKITSDDDCSLNAAISWTDTALTIVADIKDDAFFPPASGADWWQSDSLEFWIDGNQYAVYPQAMKTTPVTTRSKQPLQNSHATTETSPNGYHVLILLDWKEINLSPKAGQQFRFALGINDADSPNGRDGQLYYPSTWTHSQPTTFALAELKVSTEAANIIPQDAFTDMKKLADGNGVEYLWHQLGKPVLHVRAELPDDKAELKLTVIAQDGDIPLNENLPDMVGFILDEPDAALTCCDGASGHYYPLREEPFQRPTLGMHDLPVAALTCLDGHGYGLLVDSSDDAMVSFRKIPVKEQATTRVPQVTWMPSMKKFGSSPRSYRYCFVAKGGYVAVAKIWREWAKANGYLVTFKEKAKHNPNVYKLMGAADLWDGGGLEFCKLAKSYGIDKLLLNGAFNAQDMAEASKMGYLLGRYDIYTDVYTNREAIDAFSAPLPAHAVRNADGTTKKAWTTFDGSRTSWKRCTALMLEAAKICMPPDLARFPYNARFLDVTTAEGLYECYHPDHPMTRTDKRKYSEGVVHYMGSWTDGNLNLITGGEHGKWWGARDMHYFEGMQSGGHANYSWPAGYRRRPKNKQDNARNDGKTTDVFTRRYEVYGVGPKYRVPFWDLCLHDCVTTTWYWGDTNDFLIEAAPEVTPRKDCFNILQASMPTYCINRLGTWHLDRSSFLRSYFHITKVHENIGMEEMLSHEFLNQDRTIHKTTFTGGYEIIVNMDAQPQDVVLKGKSYHLAPNGFAVDGPNLHQEMILKDNLYYSHVRTKDFYFASKATDPNPHIDGKSSALSMLTVKAENEHSLRVSVMGDNSLDIAPEFFRNWDWNTTLAYKIDDKGNRLSTATVTKSNGTLRIPQAGNYVIVCAEAARRPDYHVELLPNGNRNDIVLVKLTNNGYGTAPVAVRLYADTKLRDSFQSYSQVRELAHGESVTIELQVVASKFAGKHKMIIVAETDGDLMPADNQTVAAYDFPFVSSVWPVQLKLTVPALPVDSELEPCEQKIDFASAMKPNQEIAASSVHVVSVQGTRMSFLKYAQFIPDEGFDGSTHVSGTICFSYDAQAGRPADFLVVAQEGRLAPDGGCLFLVGDKPGEGTFTCDEYTLGFSEATIVDAAPGSRYGGGPDFLKALLVSSQETGWAHEEQAVINGFDVLLQGPAKCIVRADKTLRNGARYVKTYTLYPGRFIVEATLDKRAGSCFSRGMYAIPGIYLDDKGHTVEMAKTVDGANIAGQNPDPKWYAIRGQGWSHSCIALTKYGNIIYWDASGQIGFTTDNLKGNRYCYFIYGNQPDFKFAENDYRRATLKP